MNIDLDLYFERIGWYPGNETALEKLRQIHRNHVMSIPFENLDVYLKKEVSVTPDAVFEKLVVNKRGGYCFEMNCLLHSVLAEMGYDVAPYLARISRGPMGFGGYSHRVNAVNLDGKRYVLDVGFGGDCFQYPVLLEPDIVQEQPHMSYKVINSDAIDICIQSMRDGRFYDMLGFNDRPAVDEDFIIGNFYTNCHPQSFFRGHIMCCLSTDTGKISMFDDRLTILSNGQTEVKQITNDTLSDTLKEYFGITIEAVSLNT